MAGRIVKEKTLFLDEREYNIFKDFDIVLGDLCGNLHDEDLEILLEAFEEFTNNVMIQQDYQAAVGKGREKSRSFLHLGVDKKYLLCYNVGPRPLEAVRSAELTPIWQIFIVV